MNEGSTGQIPSTKCFEWKRPSSKPQALQLIGWYGQQVWRGLQGRSQGLGRLPHWTCPASHASEHSPYNALLSRDKKYTQIPCCGEPGYAHLLYNYFNLSNTLLKLQHLKLFSWTNEGNFQASSSWNPSDNPLWCFVNRQKSLVAVRLVFPVLRGNPRNQGMWKSESRLCGNPIWIFLLCRNVFTLVQTLLSMCCSSPWSDQLVASGTTVSLHLSRSMFTTQVECLLHSYHLHCATVLKEFNEITVDIWGSVVNPS